MGDADRRGAAWVLVSLLLLLGLAACDRGVDRERSDDIVGSDSDVGDVESGDTGDLGGVVARMRFDDLPRDFWAAPFPGEQHRKADGRIALDLFPNPDQIAFVDALLAIGRRDLRGFGLSSGIFFPFSGALATSSLPDPAATTGSASAVFLISVDARSPDFGKRYPIRVGFENDGGPFGASNLLSLIPVQGFPLRPRTLYAAVVLRELLDADGRRLSVAPELRQLLAGGHPAGLSETALASYRRALSALATLGVSLGGMAALTVFETQDPFDQVRRMREEMYRIEPPRPTGAFQLVGTYETFCAYETTIEIPQYQHGTPPYFDGGGGWLFDENGKPRRYGTETANLVVTIPRRPMPSGGFPAVVVVRAGGAGVRPLVDRGVHTKNNGPSIPGTGPARELARVGFMGVQVDGPHTGLRNITKADDQFLLFNLLNPEALRDNIRESALELVLFARTLALLKVEAPTCPGVTTPKGYVTVDLSHVGIFGHSTGSLIAQMAQALQPVYHVSILSGAGSSYIENLVYKRKPLPVKPLAEATLKFGDKGRILTIHEPILSVVQWIGESSDPQLYGRHLVDEPLYGRPRSVLMLQGIVDNYNLPPMANTTSISIGLDLVGKALDESEPRLSAFDPLSHWFSEKGTQRLSFPVEGNRLRVGELLTAVVVQFPEDGIEDGHEVAYQLEEPKIIYRAYLESWISTGVPRVIDPQEAQP